MENLKKVLPSGAMLEVSMASFGEAYHLLEVVATELESINISLGSKGQTLKDLFSGEGNLGEESLNTIKNVFMRGISSRALRDALYPCIQRGMYKGAKISGDTFEDPATWGDYLIIQKEVLIYILSPFMKNLSSFLPENQKKNTGSQSQPS